MSAIADDEIFTIKDGLGSVFTSQPDLQRYPCTWKMVLRILEKITWQMPGTLFVSLSADFQKRTNNHRFKAGKFFRVTFNFRHGFYH